MNKVEYRGLLDVTVRIGGQEEDQHNGKFNLSELNTCGMHCICTPFGDSRDVH